MSHDFAPSTKVLADLVASVTDADLTRPTPCPAYTVADLVDHVGGLTMAFTAAATKTPLEGEAGPSGDGSRLELGFRDRIATDLAALAAAWSESSAYDGMTQAGPVELPAPIAAQVALNEIVVHGWDLAVALGTSYDADPAAVEVCLGFVSGFEPPADAPANAADGGLFGPPVAVAATAPTLDRLLGLAGRDPGWSA